MKKIEIILRQLSQLYEFNKKLKIFRLKKKSEKGQPVV
jgi:hypothetical protein